MDNFVDILSTFSVSEQNEFRNFLSRQKQSDARKDLQLFDELSGRTLRKNKKRSVTAYHSLRKRLNKQLADFIVLKQVDDDVSNDGNLMGLISLCRYLFDHDLPKIAWKYLRKAERMGIDSERFDLLVSVYLLMIENKFSNDEIVLNDVILAYENAKAKAEEDRQLLLATAIIRERLNLIKQSAELEKFPAFVEETLNRFDLSAVLFNRPAHLYRLLEIVRNTYLALREMKNFETFCLEQYSKFLATAKDKKQHHFFRLRFLYMIAHALYRNRKFQKALESLENLYEEMNKYNRKYFNLFYPRYIMMVGSIKCLLGDNDTAIQLHEDILVQKNQKLNIKDQLNIELNLASFYFNSKEFKKSNRIFLNRVHSESFYEKKMGKEWVLRSKMIQVLVQYELAHEDISLQLIKNIEKDYAVMFSIPIYNKAGVFIRLIKQYILDPYSISYKEFRRNAAADLFLSNAEDEESKAIAFYCWLKSKLTQKDYYETLQEEVQYLPGQ